MAKQSPSPGTTGQRRGLTANLFPQEEVKPPKMFRGAEPQPTLSRHRGTRIIYLGKMAVIRAEA